LHEADAVSICTAAVSPICRVMRCKSGLSLIEFSFGRPSSERLVGGGTLDIAKNDH
jgi:hypothetical protein